MLPTGGSGYYQAHPAYKYIMHNRSRYPVTCSKENKIIIAVQVPAGYCQSGFLAHEHGTGIKPIFPHKQVIRHTNAE